jgi:hypothetical protein
MKIIVILFTLLTLLPCAGFAQTDDEQKAEEIKATIERIEKDIVRQEGKLATTVSPSVRLAIFDIIEGHKGRIVKLKKQLAEIEAAGPPPEAAVKETVTEEAEAEVAEEMIADEEDEITKTKQLLSKVQAEIDRLQGKLSQATAPSRIQVLTSMIEDQQARQAKLKKELLELEKAQLEEQKILEELLEGIPEEAAEAEVPPPAEDEVYIPIEVAPAVEPEKNGRLLGGLNFEIGGLVGFYSASTSFIGEIRIPTQYIFGPATTSLRLSGGFAQSGDTSRRYAPIMADAVLNFPAGWITGVENYLGAGLNYVVLTSGMQSGTIGGQVFYGVESDGFLGKLYGELGFGILRTGFSPSHKGVTVMMGYLRQWWL